MFRRLIDVGQELNPPVMFDYRGDISSTLTSHRLLHWARTKGSKQQHALIEYIFKAYFVETKDQGRADVLLGAVDSANAILGTDEQLSREEAAGVIESDQFEAITKQTAQQYKNGFGISGVPFFTFQNTSGKVVQTESGAVPTPTLVEAFDRALFG